MTGGKGDLCECRMEVVREIKMPFLNNRIVVWGQLGQEWAKYQFDHVNIQLLVEKCEVLQQKTVMEQLDCPPYLPPLILPAKLNLKPRNCLPDVT